MNNKGFVNIILVIIVVILAGTVGYFIFGKKSESIISPTPTVQSPTPTSNNQLVPTPQSGKIVIQELALDDGSRVSLISSNSVTESSKLNKIFNCKLPEIETANVSLEYEGKTIPLGFIGIPEKTNESFPTIENTINYGLENLVKSLEWSPLQKLARGFGVIDYSTVKSVDPKSTGSLQTFWEACYLHYRMQFFEVDKATKSLKLRDTGNGIDLYGELERFKKEITPGCSPFGCG